MTMENGCVEAQIREVLASETQAIPLSNKLFHPNGLFNALAKTEDERRLVAKSLLFRQAQKRLLELQRKEAGDFSNVIGPKQEATNEGSWFLKLERADHK